MRKTDKCAVCPKKFKKDDVIVVVFHNGVSTCWHLKCYPKKSEERPRK